MGRSKTGGVFGFIRGRVGAVSYNVISAKRSSTGKKMQGMRAIPEEVANPQTVAQCLQRMKLGPAQKFFNAFAPLLNNAFQGVEYGDKSRQYFLSKCMKLTGPYIPKGVDRFIPAQYPFSEGTIPSVEILPFTGGANLITLGVTTSETSITPAILAAALGVNVNYQITVVVVNNVAGTFEPSYIGYEDRLTIADVNPAALGVDGESHITINPVQLGLAAANMVACCVVLSVQDAGGKYLRSTQDMVISNELYAALYNTDAMEMAIASYQTDAARANAVNSEWYYNLGMAQAWPGKLTTIYAKNGEFESMGMIAGIKSVNGIVQYTVFVDNIDNPTGIMEITDNDAGTFDVNHHFTVAWAQSKGYAVEQWQDNYATQLGLIGAGVTSANAVDMWLYDGEEDYIKKRVTGFHAGTFGGKSVILFDCEDGVSYPAMVASSSMRTYGGVLSNINGNGNDPDSNGSAWVIPSEQPAVTARFDLAPDHTNGDEQLANANAIISMGVSYTVWIQQE